MLEQKSKNNSAFGLLSSLSAVSFFMLFSNLIFIFFPYTLEQVILYNLVSFFFIFAEHIFEALNSSRQNQKLSSKTRLVILVMLLNYTLVSMLLSLNFPTMFIPNALSISSTLIVPLAAFLASNIHKKILSRQEINALVEGASSQQELSDIFASHSTLVIQGHKMAKSLRSISRAILFLSIFLLILFSFVGNSSPFILIWFLMTLICSLSLMSNAQAYLEEHRFFQFGLASSVESQKKKQNLSLLLIIIALVFSFASSNDKALFSPAIVGQFLASIFSPTRTLTTSENYLDNYRIDGGQYDQVIQGSIPTLSSSVKTVPFFENFFIILQYVLVAIGLVILVYFLLKPLIEEKLNFGQIVKQIMLQLINFIFGPFKLIYKALKKLGQKKPAKAKLAVVTKDVKPREYIETLIKNTLVDKKEEKKIISRSLKIYLEFLEWVYEKGYRWSLSDTPQEISQNCSAFITQNQYQVTKKLADLLEKDLFSLHKLDESALGLMSKLVVDLKTK